MTVDRPIAAAPPARRSAPAMILFASLFLVLLSGDLLLKWWAFNAWPEQPVDVHAVLQGQERLPDKTAIPIPDVLALKLTLNTGAVFGLGDGYRWLFVCASVVAVLVIGFFFCTSRANHRVLHVALAMILAGAIGNLYDRVELHAVRDMLWLFPGVHLPFGWSWPGGVRAIYPWIFNLADAFLLLGIGIILLRSILVADHPEPDEQATPVRQPATSADDQSS